MWAIIMIIWWATGASVNTLGYYVIIGLGASFVSYWFSDKLAIASMHAQPVTEQQAAIGARMTLSIAPTAPNAPAPLSESRFERVESGTT